MTNLLQTKTFFRATLLGMAVSLGFLGACDHSAHESTQAVPVQVKQTNLRLYVAPPRIPGQARLDLQAQAMGAFAELRNQAQAKGFALQACNNVVIFVRQDALSPNQWQPVQRATRHYFGTPLTPNSPPVHMIAVHGFANPGQLLLVEADFSR